MGHYFIHWGSEGQILRGHWQNLSNEDEHGQGRGFPFHGRAWLRVGANWGLQWEWCFEAKPRANISVSIDEEHGPGFGIRLFLAALWVHINVPYRWRKKSRHIELSWHNGSLWWDLWRDPWGGWDNRVPRWRHGNFNVVDFLLGKEAIEEREIRTETVPVPLPEGTVRATVELSEMRRKRPRWFAQYIRLAKIEPEKPAPVPGKGENSWDCGPDAIYSMSCAADTAAEAVGKFVESVLRTRRKRGAAWDYAERS